MGIRDLTLMQRSELTKEVLAIMDSVLNLNGRTASFKPGTPLLGAQPELDSMGVVALLTAFEERLNLVIDDDDMDGAVFETLRTLMDFVTAKLAA